KVAWLPKGRRVNTCPSPGEWRKTTLLPRQPARVTPEPPGLDPLPPNHLISPPRRSDETGIRVPPGRDPYGGMNVTSTVDWISDYFWADCVVDTRRLVG